MTSTGSAPSRIRGAMRDTPHGGNALGIVVQEVTFPPGFGLHTGNIGIKDQTEDVMIISAPPGTTAAGVALTKDGQCDNLQESTLCRTVYQHIYNTSIVNFA